MRSVLIIAKPYDAEVMRSALASAGFSAAVSDGTDDPAARVEHERPDAVVLALRLPGTDGTGVLEAIRGGERGSDVPVVLVADSSSDVSTLGDAVSLGADQLLLRPVNPPQLLAKVGAVLDLDTPEPPPIRPASTLIPAPRTGEHRLTSSFANDASPLPRWRAPTQVLGSSPMRQGPIQAPPTLPEATISRRPDAAAPPTARGDSSAQSAIARGDSSAEPLAVAVRSVRPDGLVDDDAGARAPSEPADPQVDTPRPQPRPGLARELQAEIDAIDRRLFPDAPAPFSLVDEEDDDFETLDNIDVDRIGVDTFPGAVPRRPRPTSRTLVPAARREQAPAADEDADERDDIYMSHPGADVPDVDDEPTREHDTAEESHLGDDDAMTVAQARGDHGDRSGLSAIGERGSSRSRKRRRSLTGPVAPSRRRRRRRPTEGRAFSDGDRSIDEQTQPPPAPGALTEPMYAAARHGEAAPIDEDPLPLVAVELAGDLRATTFAQLLDQLRRTEFTGRLDLAHAETHKSVFFEDGQPVFASSNAPTDRLSELLLREGKITREQHGECEQLVGRTGRRLGAILVDNGLIKAQELFPLVRRHVAEILYSLFAWTEGRYELKPQEPRPEEKIRLDQHPAELLAEGVRRKMGLERLLEAVGGHEVAVVLPSDAISHLDPIELTAAERAVVSRFTGDETLGELVARGVADELTVIQSAFIVIALGLGAVRGQRGAAVGSLDRAREVAIDRQRLETKYAQVCEADYFSLLGLRADASGHEVMRAYQRVRAEFEPATFPPDLVAEHAERISEIVYVIDEAFRVLSDDVLRTAYRETL